MDTPELAALVPDLMTRHPGCEWTILSGRLPGEDLVIELHPRAWPDRVATVRVITAAEVFSFAFAGHVGHDFAYADIDRPDALRERIDLAVDAARGPTRVTRERRSGMTVGSALVLDPDGPHPRRDTVSYPRRRLRSRLTGGRTTREVEDFPGLPDSPALPE